MFRTFIAVSKVERTVYIKKSILLSEIKLLKENTVLNSVTQRLICEYFIARDKVLRYII